MLETIKMNNIEFARIRLSSYKNRKSNVEIETIDYLRNNYPTWKVEYSKKDEEDFKGIPDLIIDDGSSIFFIEIKGPNDGIKKNQLLWAANHKEVRIIYLFVDYSHGVGMTKEELEEIFDGKNKY